MCLTTPETFDLTEISFSGSMVPTARALSTIVAFRTLTFGRAPSAGLFDPPRRRNIPAARTTMTSDEMRIFFFMAISEWAEFVGLEPRRAALGGTMEGRKCYKIEQTRRPSATATGGGSVS